MFGAAQRYSAMRGAMGGGGNDGEGKPTAAPSSSCQEISTKWRDYICIQISGTSSEEQEYIHAAPAQSMC